MINENGVAGGLKISKGSQSTWGKPAQVPLGPPKIPPDLTWNRT
jgi:hypothetical protein